MNKRINNIEVEARSFIDKSEFRRLKNFFDKNGKLTGEINDQTVYFSGPKDLRIRRDESHAYLILKEGKIHDDHREEIEINFGREDFGRLEQLLLVLSFKVEIRWQRRRRIYRWRSVKVFLDDTRGYGQIIELEEMASQKNKVKIHKQLVGMLESLGIKITPKEEFNQKFEFYKRNWRNLLMG
jgi:predicted adenylyl cyclase CyaB